MNPTNLAPPEFRPGWDSNSRSLTPKQIHCTLTQLGGQEIRYHLEYWIWGDDCTGPQLHVELMHGHILHVYTNSTNKSDEFSYQWYRGVLLKEGFL